VLFAPIRLLYYRSDAAFATKLLHSHPITLATTTHGSNTMAPSKFTEIMEPEDHYCTSPQSDVRLEDILAATDLHNRGRTPSETSNSSRDSRQNSGDRVDNKTKQRLSRLLSISKK
jgi:hypothetical protein